MKITVRSNEDCAEWLASHGYRANIGKAGFVNDYRGPVIPLLMLSLCGKTFDDETLRVAVDYRRVTKSMKALYLEVTWFSPPEWTEDFVLFQRYIWPLDFLIVEIEADYK